MSDTRSQGPGEGAAGPAQRAPGPGGSPSPARGHKACPCDGQEGPSTSSQCEHSQNRVPSALVTVPAGDDVLIFSHHVILQYFPGSA